jgi:2-dehydropantoate 2-reductase
VLIWCELNEYYQFVKGRSMSSHVVFGAGLIGSFLGACMQHLEINVALVSRTSFKKKLAQGVTLTDYLQHQARVERLNFLDPEILPRLTPEQITCNYVWLTVKCHSVAQAVHDIAPLISTNTVILCCQNGLDSDKPVKEAFPDNLVLRVMVPFNVVELEKGHLHRGSQGHLTIEQSGQSNVTDALVSLLNSPLLPVAQTQDMQGLLWAKLQLNLGNSINALADIPVKSMLEQRGYRLVMATLMQELLLVTKALGLTLPKVTSVPASVIPYVLKLPDFLFTRVASKMLAVDPNVRTSMWWDMAQGKPTEIAYLNGAVVDTGARIGISTPANKRIVALIKSLSHDKRTKTENSDASNTRNGGVEVTYPNDVNFSRPVSAEQLQKLIGK